MFFSVARLRLSLALVAPLFFAQARARDEVLFTSSVSYCAPPDEILVQQLDLAYFKANNSVSFNVSAAAVLPNLNVSANIYVNVYGMQPVNVTLDLCSLFNGIICPLPEYNFIGADSITIPSQFDVTSHLPGIAYVIPNLEAYVQLMLVEVGTNDVKACVQATLSNGWSARQYAVEWTTAAITLLALAAAIWKSLTSDVFSLAPIRLLDLIYLLQTIAVSGLLGLNYPLVYTAFALNFSWVIGLFSQSPNSPMQNSINNMRHLTGGDSADASSNGATPLVNRKLSPYNAPSDITSGLGSTYSASQSLLAKAASMPSINLANANAPNLISRSNSFGNATTLAANTGDVAVVTSQSDNVLQAGIPIYVNTIGIATADAFMTVFLTALIYAAVVLGALALGYAIYYALVLRTRKVDARRLPGWQTGYMPFARAWGLRAAIVVAFPLLVFIFYQWTLKDSWLSVLLSVIALVILMALVLPPFFLAMRPYLPRVLSRTNNASTPTSVSLAPIYAQFRAERIWYAGPLLLAIIVKALVVAFGHAHGLAQAIVCVIVDAVMLISLCVFKPYRSRRADILQGYLAIVRLVCSGLLIAFAESIALMAIPRVVIGIITAIIFAVAVVIMFFNILVNMGLWRLVVFGLTCGRRGGKRRGDRVSTSDDDAMLVGGKDNDRDVEKLHQDSDSSSTPGSSNLHLVRPGNPTPPTTEMQHSPVSAGSLPNSWFTESTETTLGEPLPRRWSFQHSRPPSASETSPTTASYYSANRTSGSATAPQTPVSTRHSRHPSAIAPVSTPIEEDVPHEGIAL
ncbi:TRP-domain-containing protein [Wolfiporia cocos MD-104 SS10]|uniref:TRP-domain-containing protein n=1 Tax=Wolfiporia cocos (strain MD-104) TaxID=742152 RepID=A0A2H3JQ78_WOLCO|nr:TRP-domain-containing protein [Wolfiporia cocos MD-104 SS10]